MSITHMSNPIVHCGVVMLKDEGRGVGLPPKMLCRPAFYFSRAWHNLVTPIYICLHIHYPSFSSLNSIHNRDVHQKITDNIDTFVRAFFKSTQFLIINQSVISKSSVLITITIVQDRVLLVFVIAGRNSNDSDLSLLIICLL